MFKKEMLGKSQSVRRTRNELYEKVWSQFVSSLAKEMEISDVGLPKIRIGQDGLKDVVKLQNLTGLSSEIHPQADHGSKIYFEL
jgi:hypothetical protein